MKSIRIDQPNNEDTIRKIWMRNLQWDPEWHFFYEDSYMVVRCGDNYLNLVCCSLDCMGIRYKVEGEWIDNIGTTKKYQDIFKQAFHAFSELAMRTETSEFINIVDRIIHCFMNNMRSQSRINHRLLPIGDEDHLWEPMVVVVNAILRSRFLGYLAGRSK